MSQSRRPYRTTANRSLILAIAGTVFLSIAAAGTSAASFSLLDAIRGALGISSPSASALPLGNGPELINEVLFNPPGTDGPNEYVEIRSVPNRTIPAGTYLVGIEGDSSSPGDVQTIFDLSGLTIGSNGYLTIRQMNNTYTVDGASTSIVGTGTGFTGAAGFAADSGTDIENSSASFLLITTSTAPTLADDIDPDNDGVADGVIYAGWLILDPGVGVVDAPTDSAYSPVVYSTSPTFVGSAGRDVVVTTTAMGYLGRQGTSGGNTSATDWFAGALGGTAPNWTMTAGDSYPAGYGGQALNHIGAQNPLPAGSTPTPTPPTPTPTPPTPTPTPPTPTPTPPPATPTPTPPPASPTPSPNPSPSPSCTPTSITEGFDTITANVPGPGWFAQNNSAPLGTTTWFQGNSAVFPSHTGVPTSYIGGNFNSTAGTGTISTWLLTPAVTLQNGAQMTFWTRGTGSTFPDRLQVRMSTAGASTNVGTAATDVGDFTALMLDINPTYQTGAGGYPAVWTQQTITVTGVPSPTLGRFAFRYFVENGGPSGSNSDYIGIDTFAYNAPCGPVPTPTPGVTPTPTPTPPPATPTPTPPPATPTPTPTPPPGCAGQTFPASGLPVAVPDNTAGGVPITITVSGLTGTLTSAQLRDWTWNPMHTWGGDIKMTLQAPSGGPTATIVERRGRTVCTTGVGSSNDLVGPYNFGDGFPNTFHTVAGNPVPAGDYSASQCVTTPGEAVSLNTIFGGPVRPTADSAGLEVFDGMAPEAANGNWTLTVSDNAAGDTGTISAINLCLVAGGGGSTPTPTPTPPPATPTPTPPPATPTPSPSPTCVPGSGTPGTWSNGIVGPSARYRHGAVSDGNFVYVFGGGDSVASTRFNDLWRWDPTTGTWTQLANMPTGKQNIQGAYWNGKIYVPGGYNATPAHITENAIYDIGTNTWSTGAPEPAAVSGATVAYNNKVYVFGGNPGPTAITRIYDISSNTWSTGASMPTATTYGRAVVVGNFAYYIGGIAGATTAAVHRYDLVADTWSTMAPLQTARASAEVMASPDGTSIFAVMGGDSTFFTGVPLVNSVEIYNIAANSWSYGNPVVTKAAAAAGGLAGGKLMMQGGVDTTTYLNAVQISTLSGGGGCPTPTPPPATPTPTPTPPPATPTPTPNPSPSPTCPPGGGAAQVVPPAYTSTQGTTTFTGPLANAARTYQLLINANQLTGMVGQQLTGLTWRLPVSATVPWPAADINFANYDIRLSESVAPALRSLTFANNVVGPQTLVRSGPLTVTTNSYPSGGTPNAFGPDIAFNTPWLYAGGHLLIEIRHDGFTGTSRSVDGIGTAIAGYGTDFSAAWTGSYTGTTGSQGNFPIARLTAGGGGCATPSPTPPPATPTPTPPPATPTPSPGGTPEIRFSANTYYCNESMNGVITLVRNFNTTGTNTVNLATSNGTAVGGAAPGAGIDYQNVNTNVTFLPTEASKNVNVPCFGDTLTEATETVNLTLSGPFTRPGGEDEDEGTTAAAPEVQNAVLNIIDTASAYRFTNPICVTLGGTADAYPAPITVPNGPASIAGMRVTLYDLSYTFPDHIDALLVGPGGQKFVMMGDAGGAIPIPPGSPVTLSFRDIGPGVLPNSGPLVTGNFEPTTWETPVTNFPGLAPAGPYSEPGSTIGGTGTQTFAGNFGGTNANGVWNLWIRDDAGVPLAPEAISGCINGGWGLEFLSTTAANASISGRVLTADGRPIRNVTVSVTGNSLSEPRVVQTGSFGYYNFDDLRTGETYVITVQGRRYFFQTPSQIVSLTDNIADLNFIAVPDDTQTQ